MAAMSPLGAGAGGMAMGGPTAPDFVKLHQAERDNLELVGLDLQSQAESIANNSDLEGGRKGKVVTKSNASGNGNGENEKLKMRWVGDGIEDRILNMYS